MSGGSAQGLGRPRVHLRRTDSTNERARALAGAGAPHGTLVTAEEQTAGRGRHGRRWSAPPGSALLMSLLIRWAPAGDQPQLLPLSAAVAACETVGGQALLKWPNDVVLARDGGLAKLGGILIEGRPQEGWALLGIGLNVAVEVAQLPGELRRRAATMGLAREQIEPTLERLLQALRVRLYEEPEATLAAWRERDALRGRRIAWSAGEGSAQGIDPTGRLIVARDDGGRVTLRAGEVHLQPL
jgi:BirA family transcriptional regulator, biotin operon repressor / biotin---[acetyl-CoA-carboxylase] ligase